MPISPSRVPRRLRALSAGVAMAALVSACSSSGTQDAGGPAGPAESSPTTTPSDQSAPNQKTTAKTFELASSSYPAVGTKVPSEPIASAPAEQAGTFIDVYALERSGSKSVLLVIGFRNESASNDDVPKVADNFGEGRSGYNTSGVSLFDPSGLKRYLVYLDSKDACVCSETTGEDIPVGETRLLAAQLSAPPRSVKTVSVQTPIGSVSDVEISNG